MQVSYDKEGNVLHVTTEAPKATAASLLDDPGIAVELVAWNGHEIVGVIVMGASVYIPLGLGYDSETDTLIMGTKTSDPALVTETGDFVGYWQVDEENPDGARDPIGVALKCASKHLAEVLAEVRR